MCSDFYVNHLPCCVPPTSIFFSKKDLPKKLFMGGGGHFWGKFMRGGT